MLEDSTAHLAHTCVFTVVPNAFIALECTEHTCYHLIIATKNLIDLHAIDMMKILDAVGATTPVVVLIERGEEYNPAEMEGLRLYLDVLRRPFCTADLCRVIQAAIDEMENPKKTLITTSNESDTVEVTVPAGSSSVPALPVPSVPSLAHSIISQDRSAFSAKLTQQPQLSHPPKKSTSVVVNKESHVSGIAIPSLHVGTKTATSSTSNVNVVGNGHYPASLSFQESHEHIYSTSNGPPQLSVHCNDAIKKIPIHSLPHHINQVNHQHLLPQKRHSSRSISLDDVGARSAVSNMSSTSATLANALVNRNGNNAEELTRWKECIHLYSQELSASISGMVHTVVSTESAGSLGGPPQQQYNGKQLNRPQCNFGLNYDHLMSLQSQPVGQMIAGSQYYRSLPYPINPTNHISSDQLNGGHSSSDEGGTSTTSSIEDGHVAFGLNDSTCATIPNSHNVSSANAHNNSKLHSSTATISSRKRTSADL